MALQTHACRGSTLATLSTCSPSISSHSLHINFCAPTASSSVPAARMHLLDLRTSSVECWIQLMQFCLEHLHPHLRNSAQVLAILHISAAILLSCSTCWLPGSFAAMTAEPVARSNSRLDKSHHGCSSPFPSCYLPRGRYQCPCDGLHDQLREDSFCVTPPMRNHPQVSVCFHGRSPKRNARVEMELIFSEANTEHFSPWC